LVALASAAVVVSCTNDGPSDELVVGSTRPPVTAPETTVPELSGPEADVYQAWLGFWAAYDPLSFAPGLELDYTEFEKYAIESYVREVKSQILANVSAKRVEKIDGDVAREWTTSPVIVVTDGLATLEQCANIYVETYTDGSLTTDPGVAARTYKVQFILEGASWKIESGTYFDGCVL
jgi:hypothetical protein